MAEPVSGPAAEPVAEPVAERLVLVVRAEAGRQPSESRIVLEPSEHEAAEHEVDEYEIGSAPSCAIRLPHEAPLVGRLQVAYEEGVAKLTYIPVWQDGDGKPITDSAAAAPLDVGNSIRFKGATLWVEQAADESAPPPTRYQRLERWFERTLQPTYSLPERQRKRQWDDLKLVHGGARTHKLLMRRLGAIIDEDEAERIRPTFGLSRWVTGAAVAAFVVVSALALLLASPEGDSERWNLAAAIVLSAVVVAFVTSAFFYASGGAFCMAFAGTVFAVLFGDFSAEEVAIAAVLFASLGGVLGYAMESYWCPLPSHYRLVRGTGHTLLFFVCYSAYAFIEEDAVPWGLRAAFITACAAVVAWTLLGVPMQQRRLMQQRSGFSFDALLLLEVARARWRRRHFGLLAAACLAFAPALILLNAFGLEERTGLGQGDALVSAAGDTGETYWYWAERGELLRRDHFSAHKLYAVGDGEWEQWPGIEDEELPFTEARGGGGPGGVGTDGARLEEALAAHRVESEDEFLTLFHVGTASPKKKLWLLEARGREAGAPGHAAESTAGADPRPASQPASGRVVRNTVVAVTLSGFRSRLTLAQLLCFPAGLLVALGLLVLWRGTSEGSTAVAVALWAFGYAAAVGFAASHQGALPLQLRSADVALAALAEGDLLAKLFYALFLVFGTLGSLLGGSALLGVWTAGVVITWVWPTPWIREDGLDYRTVIPRLLLIALSACSWWFVMAGAGYALSIWEPGWYEPGPHTDAVWAALYVLLPLGIGWSVYRYRKKRNLDVRPVHGTHVALVLVVATLAACASLFRYYQPGHAVLVSVVTGLTLVLAATMLYVVVWRNEWNLAAGRGLSTIVVAVAVPLGLTLFDQYVLNALQELGLFPRQAAFLVSLVMAVALFKPLHRAVSRWVRRAVLFPVRAALREGPSTIRLLLHTPDAARQTDALKELLACCQIERFAYYVRQTEAATFAPWISTFTGRALPPLAPSEALLGRLGRESAFVDVDVALREFAYTVVAPELWRMQRRLGFEEQQGSPAAVKEGGRGMQQVKGSEASQEASEPGAKRCRYLLPVRLGGAVRGLLVVGEQAFPEVVKSEAFTDPLKDVLLAGLYGSRAARGQAAPQQRGA